MTQSSANSNCRSQRKFDLPIASQAGWERWSSRLLLVLLFAAAVMAVAARNGFSLARFGLTREEGIIFPLVLLGFLLLLFIVKLHLSSQRRLLREISAALAAAGARAERLERFSFLDPETELFNRNYLDHLFRHASKWLNRSGIPVTLLLFELLPNARAAEADHIVVEAARILRANFRGSDYLLRNSEDQFLALLPDTSDAQAQFALKRLGDKIDHWNLENEKLEIALRHQKITCAPGRSLRESLSELEQRLRDTPRGGDALLELAVVSRANQESH